VHHLATAGSGHRDINSETLSAATSGDDGEGQLARGWNIAAVSLGVTWWTQASAGSGPSLPTLDRVVAVEPPTLDLATAWNLGVNVIQLSRRSTTEP
jgi:hypothetical protein